MAKRQRIYNNTNSKPVKVLVASTNNKLNYLANHLTNPKKQLCIQ